MSSSPASRRRRGGFRLRLTEDPVCRARLRLSIVVLALKSKRVLEEAALRRVCNPGLDPVRWCARLRPRAVLLVRSAGPVPMPDIID